MPNVVITGCNGYLGTELSLFFKMHGWHVCGIDPKPPNDQQRSYLLDHEQKNIEDLKAPPWQADAVVHLGGASRMADDLTDKHYFDLNVEQSHHLEELYPLTPIYLASTTAMYNEDKQIEHKHPYTETKHRSEIYCKVAFRLGTICGINNNGQFISLIDHMIHSAMTKNEIRIEDGGRYRPLSGITYICMMILRNVTNGALAQRATDENSHVIMHLYETCKTIEVIATAVQRCLRTSTIHRSENEIQINRPTRLDDLYPHKRISSIPPDFQNDLIYDARLYRLVMECIERYLYFRQEQPNDQKNTDNR